MTTIGQDILPGIVTEVESLPAINVGGLSTANALLVGHGDLSDSEAEPNEPYTVTRGSQVTEYFGRDNPISDSIQDALSEGALPVYAVVTDEIENTQEVNSTSGTFDYAPVSEDPEDYDIENYDVEIVLEDPDNYTEEGVMTVNPVSGEYSFEETPDETEVEYVSYDYDSALEAVEDETPDEIDYVYVLSESEDVADRLEDAIDVLEQYKNFVIGGVGLSGVVNEASEVEAPFDNSRMQVFYPSRNEDGDSIMGAIGGKKASLGINGSTMNKRLSTHDRLYERIDEDDKIHLVGETVVPVASESRGAVLIDDPTCVDEDNAEEANMADGYSRLVVDRVTELVHDTERPYIGKLNKPRVRGSLQASIRTGLAFLEEQDAIQDYSVRVYANDAMSAHVDVGVETTKPLRNIYNTISVGDQ